MLWQSSCQRAKYKLVYKFSASAAELNGEHKVPARDPSVLRVVGMTPSLRFHYWWTTAISLPKIISTPLYDIHSQEPIKSEKNRRRRTLKALQVVVPDNMKVCYSLGSTKLSFRR